MADYPERDKTLDCEGWEALLVDKMDGTLSPEAEAAFAGHAAQCQGCSTLLEEAKRGQEWMKLLEARTPSAPVDLVSKILARTQGTAEMPHPMGDPLGGAVPIPVAGRWAIPFLPPPGPHHARTIMTAAMAFFSVALTLSVAGVRLSSVHAAELRPQVVQANVTRSFYGTKKQVVSFYDNLRLVYEVESKMQEMRRAASETPARPAETVKPAAPEKQKTPAGTSGGQGRAQQDEVRGWPVVACLGPAPVGLAIEEGNRL
jgi:hypothetical protein